MLAACGWQRLPLKRSRHGVLDTVTARLLLLSLDRAWPAVVALAYVVVLALPLKQVGATT